MTAVCQPCCALVYELPLTRLLLGESFHPGGAKLTRQLAEQALLGPGDQVLDLACGLGNSARLLATEFGARVTGVDYSAALLQTAQHANASLPEAQRVQYLLGEAQQLPCATSQFDVVMCECALCTFADAPRALAEMWRVLKPGGRLALSDITLNAPIPAALQSALGLALCITGARSAAEYQQLIAQGGFTAPRTFDVSPVLLEMLQQIEQRLQLADVLTGLQQNPLPEEMGDVQETLAEARSFIANGGLGYGLFVARKPRTAGQNSSG